MNLAVNMIIAWQELKTDQDNALTSPMCERVLWIDPGQIEIIVIDIFDPQAYPVRRTYQEVAEALLTKEASAMMNDPYSELLIPEDKIAVKHRKRRDEAWEFLAPLIEQETPEVLLSGKKRAAIIKDINKRSGKSIVTIRKYIRLWWRSGRVKNAFLPQFSKCGAPGKRRKSTDPNAPKLGRPSMLSKTTEQKIGVRIIPDIERRFERGIKRFYETPDQLSLEDAFKLTIQTFFHEGFTIVDGTPVPILPPAEKLPSIHQFRYWYETVYRDHQREKKRRLGEREYNLRHRALLGDSTQMAFGPGSLCQIDATIADVYLVNSLDRTKIIGRPVVYFCIDVFSRVIPGFCVTLEGPSWVGAMLALDNVASDKVAFCAEYGISIQEPQWPCQHLPDRLLADRGEFEGYNPSNLVNALGVVVHNTSPYRADEKGIVERQFGIVREKIIKFLPGYVPRQRVRGGPDYVLDATMTLDEFRKLLIYYVLDHNMNRYLKTYRKDEFMIADHVARYPLEIWNWGITNRSGHLRSVPRDIVRLNLLPRKKVSITTKGIHFGDELYYICDLAMREGWFEQARIRGSWHIEVAFDPRTVDNIYLPLNGGTQLEVCYLTSPSKHLSGRDLHDTEDYFAAEKLTEQTAKTQIQQSEAQLQAQKSQLVSEATEKTQAAHAAVGKLSKAARKKDIRGNRSKVRQSERAQHTWKLGTESAEEAFEGTSSQDSNQEEYVPPSTKVSQIRNIRDKKWGKDEKE